MICKTGCKLLSMIFLLCLITLAVVAGDTPADCHNDLIPGTWEFHLGIDCSGFNSPVMMTKFTLYAPNFASGWGGDGTWTSIYNQGFELTINKFKFFAFANYTDTTPVKSLCSSTKNGWYHDIHGQQWGCYYAIQTNRTNPSSDEGEFGYFVEKEEVKKLSTSTFTQSLKAATTVLREEENIEVCHKAPMLQHIESAEQFQAEIAPKLGRRIPADEWSKKVRAKTDWTDEEKAEMRRNLLISKGLPEDFAIPSSFDWRNVTGENFVSPVRNQKQCGSCYSFASMAVMEARARIESMNRWTPVFSPQRIVSCSEYSQGCEGGFAYLVFKFGEDFGFVEENCYPYLANDTATCNMCQNPEYWTTKNYHYVGGYYGAAAAVNMEDEMMLEIFLHGPVAIGIDASQLHTYTGGVYNCSSSETIQKQKEFSDIESHIPGYFEPTDHAVTVVGWSIWPATGEKYWIVKNSWGTTFGYDGYFYLQKGQDTCAGESMPAAADAPLPRF